MSLLSAGYEDPYLVIRCSCGHVDKEFVPDARDYATARKAENVQLVRWLDHRRTCTA